uniref:Phospholipase A2 domain-containing protein n=1 Tax=Chromera velia CCMP2878 TaxID=1169474 RepID=A0A0G4IAL5_9ALVE|mmetsp:Transcript_24419/g.47939  ORF Transcript_24419/g.47939 Transcript_24419/m.47939 type:complete len:275 (-) Transcript_24419:87-911(-)|eukprot:Cvel_12492.t1-p1 / transcript=Cvel_12492.t1 / gene=Cvel_12492 / organism=Chromera_velia_CCMP2878 / gene_product=hypothetical protein / transcript_product=hypothetical protein / location=Cvel_scaffold819:45087-46253(-) / protein_length=274 / sequence_SO=supercontig / SO=protein_coding / is_pseudo=false
MTANVLISCVSVASVACLFAQGQNCGSTKWQQILLDAGEVVGFPNINPDSCCVGHDQCYLNCAGPTQRDCDSQFKDCLVNKCDRVYDTLIEYPSLRICHAGSHLYWSAVNQFGSTAFTQSREACPSTPASSSLQSLQTAEDAGGDSTLLTGPSTNTNTTNATLEAPSFADVFDPTGDRSYGIEGCTTDPEWKDSEGDDCAAYEEQRHYCATAADYPGPHNVTATEACCVCPAYTQIIESLADQQHDEKEMEAEGSAEAQEGGLRRLKRGRQMLF